MPYVPTDDSNGNSDELCTCRVLCVCVTGRTAYSLDNELSRLLEQLQRNLAQVYPLSCANARSIKQNQINFFKLKWLQHF